MSSELEELKREVKMTNNFLNKILELLQERLRRAE